MKPLYNESEFLSTHYKDKLPCQCYHCNNIFYLTKKDIKDSLRKNHLKHGRYCSRDCTNKSRTLKQKINCTNCNSEFTKKFNQIKRSTNHFCSRSCAATFNNINKTHGTRRSKLEVWLEDQLILIYPNLNIEFNSKEAINSELDIYIPSMKLAFELNGIFHYEPIYGEDKLNKIQENDISKTKACHENKIDLCIIDTSGQNYFKDKSSKKYLDIITSIINQRIKIN
jgi:hypothetical protein